MHKCNQQLKMALSQRLMHCSKDYPIKCHTKYPVGKHGRRSQQIWKANDNSSLKCWIRIYLFVPANVC